jgi:exoribonuclease R
MCYDSGVENFLNDLIFERHDKTVFKILEKSDRLFKYKYSNGDLLIDRVVLSYENSLFSDDSDLSRYYSRIIFDILKRSEYREKKVSLVLSELRSFKSKMNHGDMTSLLFLIDKLSLILSSNLSNDEYLNHLKNIERKYDIRTNFSSSIMKRSDLHDFGSNVVDLTLKNVITMDHKYKVAYDDAISIEKLKNGNYLLGIYITNVASFVMNDTNLYEHAMQRGESIYGDYNNKFYLPMFPRELTKDFFSLDSGSNKRAIAYFFEFSDRFDFVDFRCCDSLINVKKNYSFENIDRINSNDTNYDNIYLLKRLSDSLKIDFSSDYHIYKEYGKKNIKSYNNGVGSNIISNLTIFLNTFIAEKFKDLDFPYIYRVNESFDFSNYFFDSDLKKVIKGSSFSKYSLTGIPHPVNGGRAYGHITNPMRNFASYYNQFIFLNTIIDFNNNNDIVKVCKFNESVSSTLPKIVDDLNDRLYKNDEFLDVLSELSMKCNNKSNRDKKKRLTKR